MRYHISNTFTFSIDGNWRTFHHRWHIAGTAYECNACSTTCNVREAYSKHWSNDKRTLYSAEQLEQLKTIEEYGVNNFILCNEYNRSSNQFILSASTQAVPQLLRLLFRGAALLHLRLTIHVRALSKTDYLFCSNELTLAHHLDITVCVYMMTLMLVEKIEAYMYARYPKHFEDYNVIRIKISVRRELNTTPSTSNVPTKCTLPLLYSVKNATAPPSTQDISAQAVADANLYCFRVCDRTQELYVVPYQLGKCKCDSKTQEAHKTWKRIGCGAHYIMLNDVDDTQQQLLKITNISRFLRIDDRECTCLQCKEFFLTPAEFELHKLLDCGRGFEVLQLDRDYVEIYEKCIPMRYSDYNWALYAIIE